YYGKFYADRVFHSRKRGDLCKVGNDGNYMLEDPNGTPCGEEQSAEFCKELCWKPKVTTLGPIGQSSNYYYAAMGTIGFTMELSDRLFNEPFMHYPGVPQDKYDITALEIIKEIERNNI